MSAPRKDPGGVVVTFPRPGVAVATVTGTAGAAEDMARVDVKLKRQVVRDRFLHPGGGGDAA
jgi:hypothetical protein